MEALWHVAHFVVVCVLATGGYVLWLALIAGSLRRALRMLGWAGRDE